MAGALATARAGAARVAGAARHSVVGLMLSDKQRNLAADMALTYEIAARLVAQFSTIDEAVAALEFLAHRMNCKAAGYPLPMPGEREYASWTRHAPEEGPG